MRASPRVAQSPRHEDVCGGQGLCYYIESILGDQIEGARVVFEEDGTVSLYVGTQSNGQGHETVFATFLADHTGIPADAVRIVQGDSDLVPSGGGTGGSRSVTMQTGATLATVATITNQFGEYLATKFESKDVEFDDERFRLDGSNETPHDAGGCRNGTGRRHDRHSWT